MLLLLPSSGCDGVIKLITDQTRSEGWLRQTWSVVSHPPPRTVVFEIIVTETRPSTKRQGKKKEKREGRRAGGQGFAVPQQFTAFAAALRHCGLRLKQAPPCERKDAWLPGCLQ